MTNVGEQLRGPDWTPLGLDLRAGRFPLQVEKHMLNMTARLLPGVSTVTINARYYNLHALVALEAGARDLDWDDALRLLRRVEVVFAAAALVNRAPVVSTPHGAGVIAPRIAGGTVDVDALSTPKVGYSDADRGFWGPYLGSEAALGLIDPLAPTRPGRRCDEAAIRSGFDGIIELAEQSQVSTAELSQLPHLRLDGAGLADGVSILALLANPPTGSDNTFAATDRARRATSRTLLGAIAAHPGASFSQAFHGYVAFSGDGLTEAEGDADAVAAWRGVLLRRYSVGAWRRIWQWLVDLLEPGALTMSELVEAATEHLPYGTVRDFVAQLPDTQSDDVPLPAEEAVRDGASDSVPQTEFAVLALGARRVEELTGRTRDAFLGPYTTLGPQWMAERLETWRDRPMRDFGADLTRQLVLRSQRIAMSKARLNATTGKLWMPTRVFERDGLLYRTSGEGGGDVGLRVEQLGGMLASLGAVRRAGPGWELTDIGEGLR